MDRDPRTNGGGGGPLRPTKRNRRAVIESDPEDDEPMPGVLPGGVTDDAFHIPVGASGVTYDMDTDISKLEAPTFTTLDRGPSQTMINLKWDHKLNLIGKKVVNPMIHCCDKCARPILIYGRMIPCKHVFCLTCAQAQMNVPNAAGVVASKCARCGDKVNRVEQASLGSIFMCSHGGSRYGNNGCRRTYLSQRDLEAHIKHRHAKSAAAATPVSALTTAALAPAPTLPPLPSAAAIAEATAALVSARNSGSGSRSSSSYYQHRPSGGSRTNSLSQQQISVISGAGGAGGGRPASNLITVPLQEGATIAGEQRTSDFHYSSGGGSSYHGSQSQTSAGGGQGQSYYASASSSYYRRQ